MKLYFVDVIFLFDNISFLYIFLIVNDSLV